MKKILVIYATAGIGHKKAAVAVKKALDEIDHQDAEVSLVDALDYTPKLFKWTYLQLYLLAVNRLSYLWGFMYYLTDNFYVNLFVSKIRRFNNWLNSKSLTEYLLSFNPDVIVSTHFFASEVVADLKRSGVLRAHLITIVTDYRLHSWWISNFVDTYVVSNQDAGDDLVRWGILKERIKVIGIPVEPIFSKSLDKEKIRQSFGLKPGIFTILVIGGGFGVGPIENIVKTIDSVARPIQLIAVCGHNEELVKKMASLSPALKVHIKILGFVDNVYEFMEVSDVVISKSGGITVSESLAKGLPMIVISPIPGQETGNCSFLVRHGAGMELKKVSELKSVLEVLISNPEKLNRIKEAIRKVKRPTASYDVAKMALELAGKIV